MTPREAAPALAVALLGGLLAVATGGAWLLGGGGPGFPDPPAPRVPPPVAAPPAVPRLDLNRAGAEALEGLPGLGPVLARRIVAHRDARGPFGRVEDLRSVPGLGPARWAQLRDRVTVSRP